MADGVGGWAEQDIDPAMYARTLMDSAASLLEAAQGNAGTV